MSSFESYRKRYVLGWLTTPRSTEDDTLEEPDIDLVTLTLGRLQDGLKVSPSEAASAMVQYRSFQEQFRFLKRREDRKPPVFQPPFNNPYVYEKNYKKRVERDMDDKDKEIVALNQRLAEVSLRLQSMLGSQAVERQSYKSDLSDPYRPLKVTEYFREAYNREWANAHEELKPKMGEANILVYLGKVTWKAYQFCNDMAGQQMSELMKMENSLLRTMTRPTFYDDSTGRPLVGEESQTGTKETDETKSLIKLYRKGLARASLRGIRRIFATLMSREPPIQGTSLTPAVKDYLERVVELTWMMCVQEPPMELIWVNYGDNYDPELFKPYSQLGDDIVVTVWPAVKLHRHGDVLTRGVVQLRPRDTPKFE